MRKGLEDWSTLSFHPRSDTLLLASKNRYTCVTRSPLSLALHRPRPRRARDDCRPPISSMIYAFANLELDTERYELRRDGEPEPIEPQVFEVLRVLVSECDRVVTKRELLERVWPDRVVTESTLTSRIKAARRAVGDTGREQRIILTVRGRGYRVVVPVVRRTAAESIAAVEDTGTPKEARTAIDAEDSISPVGGSPERPTRRLAPRPVQRGRDPEMATLDTCFETARAGIRQVVFVTGEPGLGKTTLVETWLAKLAARGEGAPMVAIGRCVEHQGGGEAYMPVLEALGRLARGPQGATVVEVLARLAPTWLLQMPALVGDDRRTALEARVRGAALDRMPRELAEALEVLTRERPLVVVLEDLHWCDPATVSLLRRLQARDEAAQLVVVATLRAREAEAAGHPIADAVGDLSLRRGSTRLSLSPLSAARVGELAHDHLAHGALSPELTQMLWQRTRGHPLFVVGLVRAWIDDGAVCRRGDAWAPSRSIEALAQAIPGSVAEFVRQRLQRIDDVSRGVLDAASVVGPRFTAAVVAAVVGLPVERVESLCDALCRRTGVLREADLQTSATGEVMATYAFNHDVVQQVILAGLSAARRVRLHSGIARALSRTEGEGLAPELAYHYGQAHDAARAAEHWALAAEQSLLRSALPRAMTQVERGLAWLPQLEDGVRAQLEYRLEMARAHAMMAAEGYANPTTERAHTRALELATSMGRDDLVLRVLPGLSRHYVMVGRFDEATAVGQRLLDRAASTSRRSLKIAGQLVLGIAEFFRGNLERSREHTERVIEAHGQSPTRAKPVGWRSLEGLTIARVYWAWARWMQAAPDAAVGAVEAAREVAAPFGPSFQQGLVQHHRGWLHFFTGDEAGFAETGRGLLELGERHGYAQWIGVARCMVGGALAREGAHREGLALLEDGLATWAATGALMGGGHLGHLHALARIAAGDLEGALAVLDRAHAELERTHERWYLPSVSLARAELLLRLGRTEDAERAFLDALALGREVGAWMVVLQVLEGWVAIGRSLAHDAPAVGAAMETLDVTFAIAEPAIRARVEALQARATLSTVSP